MGEHLPLGSLAAWGPKQGEPSCHPHLGLGLGLGPATPQTLHAHPPPQPLAASRGTQVGQDRLPRWKLGHKTWEMITSALERPNVIQPPRSAVWEAFPGRWEAQGRVGQWEPAG